MTEQARDDAAACGLLQTADGGMIQRVNLPFCTWLGYAREELVGKRRFQDLLTMGGRIFHQTHWAPLLRMQGSIAEVKLEVLHANGAAIPMVLNAIRRDEGGAMVHELAAFVARDRDRYEQELVRARRRLEEAVAELNTLHAQAKERAHFAERTLGIVSHDLRNPLSTIAMGAALLARGELTAPQLRVTSQILRATERANRLIADLLDFTQAHVGAGLAISPAPLDLHATVSEALDELRLSHPTRALLHVRTGEGSCVADASRLGQLVGNLVANAVAYGAADMPINVASGVEALAFTVEVHNAGAAIPPDVQAAMFEPMARGTKIGAKERSVGLGLFIVREIVRAHGGRVTVRSADGEGTTVSAVFRRTASVAA